VKKKAINRLSYILKKRWKILLFLVCLLLVPTTYFSYKLGWISNIEIKKTEDGWILEGPLHFSKFLTYKTLFLNNGKIIFVEKYKRDYYLDGLKIKPCLMCFIRDVYYVRAIDLSSGISIYRKKMKWGKHPVQVFHIFPWRDNTVVYGYYQEIPGIENKNGVVIILDSHGKIQKQFLVDTKAFAVDEKNDLLICNKLTLLELPSGKTKSNNTIQPFISAVTDNKGNLYIIRNPEESGEGSDDDVFKYIIEKYSTVPCRKVWSTVLEVPINHYAYHIDYSNDQLVIRYLQYGVSQKNKQLWQGVLLNPDNGEITDPNYFSDPYIKEVKSDNKRYNIRQEENRICVSKINNKK
jgi:hypothetical protein